jgi:molecular chaperone HscA
MLQDSYAHAQDDMTARNLAEAKVDGRRLIDASQAALRENGAALLDAAERARVEQLVADLQLALDGDDLAAVKRATEALNQGTVEFAARRMNLSVKQALTGQRLDALEI